VQNAAELDFMLDSFIRLVNTGRNSQFRRNNTGTTVTAILSFR